MNFPKTAEDLVKDYESYIKDWILANNTGKIDSDEFVSSFYEKVLTKHTLEKFDPSVGYKFETWLSTVLRNHYYDKLNKQLKENWISIDSFDNEDDGFKENTLSNEEPDHLDTIIKKETILHLIKLINNIEIDRDRVLIKLKFYQKGQSQLISFDHDDISYIKTESNLSEKEIIDYINEKVKETYGLKDKDICQLLKIADGSVGTFFKRAVSKWLNA